MQDKLQKILNIKVDAINKNIDNLNYLNGELDKNNENLEYIKDKISLFKNNEILNFDQISKEDFEKVLLMIDPNISDIFRSKTCSYEGIIYIIEGIRKSISLELTEEQNKAILSFIEGMRMKSLNLQDVIANLTESKSKLPETDLDVLSNTLENYENIISKSENNLYLTEIEEIEDALDFAEVSVEEKADMLEYLLKYNADIYLTEDKKEVHEEVKEEPVELPEFHYEPFDINANLNDGKEVELPELNIPEPEIEIPEVEEKEEVMPSLEEIQINLDQMNKDFGIDDIEKTKEISIDPSIDLNVNNSIEEETKPVEDTTAIPVELDNPYEEIASPEENHELNTVELEDIIKKIDAKLKEMDDEEETQPSNEEKTNDIPVEAPSEVEETVTTTDANVDYSEVLTKYALPELSIKGKSLEEVDGILGLLNDNKLLDDLKQDKGLLKSILNNSSLQRLEEISNLIRDNLLVKKDEFDYVFDIIIKTMPIVLVKEEALESFKKNLEFFKEHKLNIINLFDNYRELLIMNNDVLIDNYNKAKMYGFEINNDNVKYYLYNSHLIENIDYYLEAIGYEKGFLGKEEKFDGLEYIKKNPYKLNQK